jgi:hypothetical protein
MEIPPWQDHSPLPQEVQEQLVHKLPLIFLSAIEVMIFEIERNPIFPYEYLSSIHRHCQPREDHQARRKEKIERGM